MEPLLEQAQALDPTRAPLLGEPGQQAGDEGSDRRREPSPFEALLSGAAGRDPRDAPGSGAAGLPAALPGEPSPVLELCTGGGDNGLAMRRLAQVLWQATTRSDNSVTLQLCPETLGRLEMRIQVQGNTVNLDALVEDPEVARVLLVDQQELAEGLARWGLRLGRFTARCRGPDENEVLPTGAQALEQREDVAPVARQRRCYFEVVL